jgi:hypothetical protein
VTIEPEQPLPSGPKAVIDMGKPAQVEDWIDLVGDGSVRRLKLTVADVNRAFDPTVQPLWTLYATHFAGSAARREGPDGSAIDEAIVLVDYRKTTSAGDLVTL